MNATMNSFRISRFSAIVLTAAMLLSVLYVPKAKAATGTGTEYGAPVEVATPIQSATSIAIYDSVVGTEDGANVIYTTLSGEPAQFAVIDLDTYEVVRALPLPEGKDVWSHVIAPDGSVYAASSGGRLYRYSPQTKAIEELGVIRAGETAIYGLSVDEAGNVYGGTYPNAIVWKYDPATKLFSDYGRMSETANYVRSLAYHDGSLYAGLGASGKLLKLNPATGEKTDIPLPTVTGVTYGNYPFVYQLDVVDDYLFAHLSGGGISTLIAYDTVQQTWRPEQFPGFHGNRVSPPMNGKAYFKRNASGGNRLVELDLATFQTRDTAMVQDFSMKGGGWASIPNDPLLPGPTLVNMRFDGKVGFFNIETEKYYEKPAIVEGRAIPIHALEKGSDGRLYMSGYPGGSAAIYDPATGRTTVLPMGQAESIGQVGDIVMFNTYPKANIYGLDVTKPIDASNPTKLFAIGEEQDRPYVNITVGDKMYLGTIPDYGKLGGALVEYDAATKEYRVFRNVVQDQSIVGLAHKDGKIYGSTSILGGLDSDPTSAAAKVFVWDAATKQKLAEFSPSLPGKAPTMISGLTFGPDGLLWAAANGTIFAVNPDTQQVVKSKEIYPNVVDYGMWRPIHLRWGTDGLLYTDLYGKLTVVDPDTLEFDSLGINTPLFTIGDDNDIYYASSTKLMKIPVTQRSAEPPAEPALNVFNGSFERPLSGGAIPGWSNILAPSANTSFSLSEEQAFSGSHSLKVTDTMTNESIAVGSEPIPVLPNEAYTASVQLYIDAGRTSFLARFYDANGVQTGGDLIQHVTTGLDQWQEIKLTGTAPANAATIRVFASVSLLYTTTSYYDHFDVTGKFPGEDAAAGAFRLAVPTDTVQEGAILPVTVQAEHANELYAAKAVVTYDPARFAAEDASIGDGFKNGQETFFQFDAETPGVVRLIATHTGDRSVSGDLVDIATIRLRALTEGDSAITLTTASELAKIDADETGETVSPEQPIAAQVKIVKDFRDVDQDGKVDLADLVAVAKRVGGAYDAKYDVNRDGKIDVADVALVAMGTLE
ncbi:cohesin domain-containing protein [Paenibacillus sp.]|uniref:cohesin domain-containing protein n=1 Tax=Paenibacillus sp. TaxID=58172 RepID=UPI002810F615|nr:cohesin domain-containing protein [Paenibacillus sp.]